MMNWLPRFLRPIRTRKDYENTLAMVEKYFFSKKGTPEANIVEILSVLIEKYEEEHFPIVQPDPIEAIRFRMEQVGMTRQQLVAIVGSKSRVSEIFSKKRDLSLTTIRKLHTKLKIPAETLIQEY